MSIHEHSTPAPRSLNRRDAKSSWGTDRGTERRICTPSFARRIEGYPRLAFAPILGGALPCPLKQWKLSAQC